MARPTKIKIDEVLNFIEQYFEEYQEEFTAYALSKYISKKYAKCSWQNIHNILMELHQANLIKKRVTRDKTLWLPSGKQIIF